MTRKQIDKLMSVLLFTSVSLILVGAIFKLQHWAYDDQIFWTGLISTFILDTIEVYRLKKIIKLLEKKCGKRNYKRDITLSKFQGSDLVLRSRQVQTLFNKQNKIKRQLNIYIKR